MRAQCCHTPTPARHAFTFSNLKKKNWSFKGIEIFFSRPEADAALLGAHGVDTRTPARHALSPRPTRYLCSLWYLLVCGAWCVCGVCVKSTRTTKHIDICLCMFSKTPNTCYFVCFSNTFYFVRRCFISCFILCWCLQNTLKHQRTNNTQNNTQ